MKKTLLIIALAVIYAAFGSFLQHSGIIVEPAYFSLYGFTLGSILTATLLV